MTIRLDRMDIVEAAGKFNSKNPTPESLMMGLVLSVLLDIRDQNEELLNFVRED
jgi:hypothetical protein